jgi:hypothetical protein
MKTGAALFGEVSIGGKPWDRQPVSGKVRRKLGASPGFAEHTLARHFRESPGFAAYRSLKPPTVVARFFRHFGYGAA